MYTYTHTICLEILKEINVKTMKNCYWNLLCLFWDTVYTFCRSYWKTIVCYVYGVSIGEIWRKQDAKLAENTSMCHITSPEPHWMLVTVGTIFTIRFSKLILYRKKSRDLRSQYRAFFDTSQLQSNVPRKGHECGFCRI